MTKKDIIGTQVVQMHDGKSRIGVVKDLSKNEITGNEYLDVHFDDGKSVPFPFPDIIAPRYNLSFRFVDENVKNYVEQLFRDKHKAVYTHTPKPNTYLTAKEKQYFEYDTHAELLNKLLRLNLGGWRSASYIINDYNAVWMISLDNQVRSGWRNRRAEDMIYEKYVGKGPIPPDPLNHRDRLCFSIDDSGKQRYYVFEGVFKYVTTENNTRFWQKISDNYTF